MHAQEDDLNNTGLSEEEILKNLMEKTARASQEGTQEGMSAEDKKRVREMMLRMARKRAMTQTQSSMDSVAGSPSGAGGAGKKGGKAAHWRWPGGLHLYTTTRAIVLATYDLDQGHQSEACRVAVKKMAGAMYMNGC